MKTKLSRLAQWRSFKQKLYLYWIADCLGDQLGKIEILLDRSPLREAAMLASVASLLRGAIMLIEKVAKAHEDDIDEIQD